MSFLKKYFLFFVSVTGIVLVSFFSSKIVPLYDGVGFPDEPYRYVKTPAGVQNANLPPSPAQTYVSLTNGTNQSDFTLATKEQGPQASIYVYSLALSSQSAAQAIVKLEPKAPDTNKPKIGAIAGNIYNLSAAPDKGNVAFKSTAHESRGYVDLRLPQNAGVNAVMMYRSGTNQAWRNLGTTKVGNDIYEANIEGVGDYALVPAKVASANHDYKILALVIMGVLVIVLAVILALLRQQDKKSKKHKSKTK